jgi:preprotein translocase SecE subunit
MSNQRLLAMGFIVIAVSAAFVLAKLAGLGLGLVGVADADVFGGIHLSVLVGVALAGGLAAVAWMNPKAQEAGQGVAAELRKVTWPTWPEIRSATAAVVVFSVVAAVLLGVMDFISSKVMADWIPMGIRWAQGILG